MMSTADDHDGHARQRDEPPRWLPVSRPRFRALLVALVASGLAAAGVYGAPDVGDTQGGAADTAVTPSPRLDTELFKQVAGAQYPETDVIDGSVTPYSTDFYAVAFHDVDNGMAAGSDLVECGGQSRRVPVIYRYRKATDGRGVWEESYHGDCQAPGYVGAITWLGDTGEALAVGGDGVYPRGEDPSKPIDGAGYEDPAGHGRAWSFDGSEWHELSDVPEQMRGLTAVAVDQDDPSFGFAGGLGQVWQYSGGAFSRHWDATTDRDKPDASRSMHGAPLFVFRVRKIVFLAGLRHIAFGVTAGCCLAAPALQPALRSPKVLGYDGKEWRVSSLGFAGTSYWGQYSDAAGAVAGVGQAVATAEQVTKRPELPDSFYDVLASRPRQGDPGISVLATDGAQPQSGEQPPSRLTQVICAGEDGTASGETLTAGNADQVAEAARTTISSARLVAADGDTDATSAKNPLSGSHFSTRTCGAEPRRADGVADWAVGDLGSTARGPDGQDAQGLVFSSAGTDFAGGAVPLPDANNPLGYQAPEVDPVVAWVRSHYVKVTSYRLNAVSFPRGSAQGWAVGDHGALLVHGDSSVAGDASDEPAPELVGPPRPAKGPDTAAFDAFRPVVATPAAGEVPSLASQPFDQLAAPVLLPAGSPDPASRALGKVEDIGQIVMSRTGDEGWALGPSGQTTALPGGSEAPVTSFYHFDGLRWSRCDPVGLGAQLPADPACAGVAALRLGASGADAASADYSVVRLVWAARVPLENDDDPGNDDEFELVAIGTKYPTGHTTYPQPVVLRYRDGAWRFEDWQARAAVSDDRGVAFPPKLRSVAFAAPDDGWIVADVASPPASFGLYHYDGTSWMSCTADPERCGDDPDGPVLDFANTTDYSQGVVPIGVTSAGRRTFLYGSYLDSAGGSYPFIATHDADGRWSTDPARDGFDPHAAGDQQDAGQIDALVVARGSEGYEGWAFGTFGGTAVSTASASGAQTQRVGPPAAVSMRLAGGGWEVLNGRDTPLDDYLGMSDPGRRYMSGRTSPAHVAVAGGPDGPQAFVAQPGTGRLLSFEPQDARWRLVPGNRPPGEGSGFDDALDSPIQAVAPDGSGGLWVAVRNSEVGVWTHPRGRVYFFHYTDRPRRGLFEERPGPGGLDDARYTALAGTPRGTLWLTTRSDVVYRYDRALGWDRLRIPGWDAGRIVTRASEANAVAVNDAGEGVIAGRGGRIADVSGGSVALDPVSGTSCAHGGSAVACGTSRDLHAAAVAPDGSAMVGGDSLALRWRPVGEAFRLIARPVAGKDATVTGIAMPSGDRAWLALDTGEVFAGALTGSGWRWTLENADSHGTVLNRGRDGTSLALRAIAIARTGDGGYRGYAVGDEGLVLERDPGRAVPWRRLDTGFLDDLTAVTLSTGGGAGALVGGHNGLILTAVDGRLEVARPADYFGALGGIANELTGPVGGLALLPGDAPGEVEAWAALQGRGPGPRDNGTIEANNAHSALLHYTSHPDDELLDPAARAQPLPDVRTVEDGEVRLAAFGGTGCAAHGGHACPDPGGSLADHEVMTQRVTAAIGAAAKRPGGPDLALFTGDAVGNTSTAGSEEAEAVVGTGSWTLRGPQKLRRWRELVAEPLLAGGVPFFAALGGRDLSSTAPCNPVGDAQNCGTDGYAPPVGVSTMWRRAFGGMPAPWGTGDGDFPVGESRIVPVPGAAGRAHEARTHYAFDVKQGDATLVRIVVIDSALRTVTGSEANQNPLESQTDWLADVLASRPPGARAVVVSNTPTYTYGPGGQETAIDASALEAVLLREHVSALVSGRLRWNAFYYTVAPGLHEPCPGDAYPQSPPTGDAPTCAGAAGGSDGQTVAQDRVGRALSTTVGGDPQTLAGSQGVTGTLPVVVAASAGPVQFGPEAREDGPASNGYWHGYSVVHVHRDGSIALEQRPVFDWIMIEASDHTLRPGQRMALRGYGREPVGLFFPPGQTSYPARPTLRYDEIDSLAITHRYDLLEADPARPWLPRRDANDEYVPIDPTVATIDPVTGKVIAGRASHGRVYAIALLSVGAQTATFPLVFEPRRSYTPPRPVALAVPAIPRIRVLGFNAAALNAPSSPPPAAPPPPINTTLNLPAPPALPSFPSAAAPPVAPPAPPAPPPPPGGQTAVPLNLSITPVGIAVPPTTGVTAQPTPPVQPSPPSGARREAKQRQAATAKSEEGSAGGEAQGGGGDLAQAPDKLPGAQMTRRDRVKPAADGFTPLRPAHAQASAWPTGLEWGGGISLLAIALALGFTGVRPTPRARRRPPTAPAPAWSQRRR